MRAWIIASSKIKSRNMFILYGSIFAFAAGFTAYYFKPNRTLSHILLEILYELKYNVLGFKALLDDLFHSKYNRIELPNKTGKVAIVTGGSRGIGSEIVKMFLQCDMEVIIACRKPAAGERLVQRLRESGITTGSAKVYQLDNNSLESVKKFSESIEKDYRKIDILVNNAGIMFTPYGETKEGFEQQWGVNHLSHFLLTSLLMRMLKAAGNSEEKARIVNVSSCAHEAGTINFSDVNGKEKFITSLAYAQSKLAQIMFTKSLQELLNKEEAHVQVYSVHPGIVNTELFNDTHFQKYNRWFMNLFFKTPNQGAIPIVYAAVSADIERRGGIYISNCMETGVSKEAENLELCKGLFNLSLEHTGLKNFM